MKIIGYGFLLFVAFVIYSYATLPDIHYTTGCFTTSMNKVYLCPKSPHYVKLAEISPNIKNAVVISEDAGFYGHHGFDYDEIRNSFKKNIAKGAFARGGSTISQQLSKNLFLSKDKSLVRKLKEFIITQRIEQTYNKNVILEKYLNVIELGPNIYGVKDGAQYYFQKTAAAVTPLEGAFLAFLLPNPEKYGVSFKKKELTPFARARLKDILYKMNYYKKISNDEYQHSLDQLASLFTPIPQMSDEPSVQEIENNPPKIDKSTFDLTEPPDTLDEVTPPAEEPPIAPPENDGEQAPQQ